MRLPLPLRRRGVLWLLLPAAPLLVIVGNLSATARPVPGYWAWTVSHSVLLIMVPAGVAATGAALEAARLRTARERAALNVRSAPVVVLDAIWPSYACGILLACAAIAVVAMSAWGGSSRFPWGIAGTVAAILLFHTSAGFFLGAVLRPVVSIPLALAFSYVWLGFTGAIDWFAPRHLAGLVIESCCFYDEQPNPLSLSAAVSFSLFAAAALLAFAAIRLRLWSPRPAVAVGTPAALGSAALAGGLLLAAALPSTATEERAASELLCSGTEVEVCLFPEQLSDGGLVPAVQEMVLRVEGAGVPLPRRVEAGRLPASASALRLRYYPGMTDAQVAGSLASSLRDEQTLACDAEPVERTIRRQRAADIARGWVQLRMSDADQVMRDAPFTESAAVAALRERDPHAQAEWVNAARASMRDCAADPPAEPAT